MCSAPKMEIVNTFFISDVNFFLCLLGIIVHKILVSVCFLRYISMFSEIVNSK